MNEPSETEKLVRGVRRRWWLLVLLTVLAAVVGYAVSSRTPPAYAASTSVLIGDAAGVGLDNSKVQASQSLAQTFSDLARREPVLQGAVSDLKLATSWQELRSRVTAEVPDRNPQLVVITVEAATRNEAEATAAAIAKRLVAVSADPADSAAHAFVTAQLGSLQQKIQQGNAQLATLQRSIAAGQTLLTEQATNLEQQIDTWQRSYVGLLDVLAAQKAVVPHVFEPAESQQEPVRPHVTAMTALAGLVGLILGVVLAYALEVRYWVMRSGREGRYRPDAWPALGSRRRRRPAPAPSGDGVSGDVPSPAAARDETPAASARVDRASSDWERSDVAF